MAVRIERETSHGRCRSCGAAVEWATTASGTRLPFNPPIVTVPSLGTGGLVEIDATRTTSHFATCPDAEHWRKRRAAKR